MDELLGATPYVDALQLWEARNDLNCLIPMILQKRSVDR
ncbi:hypothetical protein LUTEI9C_50176 [Luteimonas sp. 9C]|nr:hypothetical protein LUTEI9C_50176 [Luteimonas sp. 9C]